MAVYLAYSPGVLYKGESLLESITSGDNRCLLELLKIGYTGEDNITKREYQYISHNPTSKFLVIIPGLDEVDEKRIQAYFDEYKYPDFGDEWFYFNTKIIDFFKEISSKGSTSEIKSFIKGLILDSSVRNANVKDYSRYPVLRELVKKNVQDIPVILSRVMTSGVRREAIGVLVDAYNKQVIDREGLMSYLKNTYGKEVMEEYSHRQELLESDQTSRDIVKRYHSSTTLVDKLKILCENSDKIGDLVLSCIPDNDELKTYYKFFGSEKIKTTGYSVASLRKSFNKMIFKSSDISYHIFNNFTLGDRILWSTIKSTLKKIYEDIGHKITPKATDLLDYFKTKEVLIPEVDPVTGKVKRSRGFQLLEVNPKYISVYNEIKGINEE